jgi:thioesterase domain-containing protein
VVPLWRGEGLPPFFMAVGGVGGEAELLVYAGLARHLDPRQPFYGLRARGVDDLVDPHESVEAMAAEHRQEIRKLQPRGPYYLGGSCMGGMVAFELARQLRAEGEEVALLLLLDSPFPSRLRLMLNRVVNYWRNTREHGLRAMLKPTDEQRIGHRKTAIGNRYFGRMLRYRPQPYDGKLTLVACAERRRSDPARVWREVVGGSLEIHEIPGDHYSHLRDHVATTAACLDECLRRARQADS